MAGLLILWVVIKVICAYGQLGGTAGLQMVMSWRAANTGAHPKAENKHVLPPHTPTPCRIMQSNGRHGIKIIWKQKQWHHTSANLFAIAFNNLFPLPQQNTWSWEPTTSQVLTPHRSGPIHCPPPTHFTG